MHIKSDVNFTLELSSDMAKTVLVTGATGFIASHTIQQLLAKTDYVVRGTVRSLKKPDRFAHLTSLPHANTRLELVEANLLDDKAWAPAVKDCAAKDLVEPAERGTENVLRAAIAEDSVKDIVLTSSLAAIADAPVDGKVFTEADWNTLSSLTRNPYCYSKVRGEQKAWELLKNVSDKRLVVLNPFLVTGPSLTKTINPSVGTFVDMFNGKVPAMANLSMGFVDVWDVAWAHVLALTNPNAKGRHILCNEVQSMQQVVETLRTKFPNAKYLLASYYEEPGKGDYIRTNVGQALYGIDNSKSKTELGLKYRPVEETLVDMIQNSDKWGFIDPKYVVN
ncbi:unnamed protein product [Aphanomyces euteiches]